MNSQPDWSLLAKFLSGECSNEEIIEVENWLEVEPENERIFLSMQNVCKTPEEAFEPSDVKALWKELTEKAGIYAEEIESEIQIHPQVKYKEEFFDLLLQVINKPVLRYSALIILIMMIPFLYYLIFTSGKINDFSDWKLVTVDKGEQSKLTLSDGTKLVLDAGTRLRYPEDFGIESRKINLEGEAYFEVVHDPEKPFFIYAGNAVVKVLGTKFNVRAWEKSDKVEVAVAEGKVSLSSGTEPDKSIILEIGYTGSLSSTGEISEARRIDVEQSLSWMKGEIAFYDTPLSEILSQVERWYDIQFVLRDSTMVSERASVFIHKNSFNEMLELITAITDTDYKVQGNLIILNSN